MFDSTKVQELREKYPVGARVKLVKMFDEFTPPEGSCGTVSFVDDIGTVHIKWDTGSILGLMVDIDKFYQIIEN